MVTKQTVKQYLKSNLTFLNSFLLLSFQLLFVNMGMNQCPSIPLDGTCFDGGASDAYANFSSVVISEVSGDAGQSDGCNDAIVEISGPPGTIIGCMVLTNTEWAVLLPPGSIIPADGVFLIACGTDAASSCGVNGNGGSFTNGNGLIANGNGDFNPGLQIDFDVCDSSNSSYYDPSASGFTLDNAGSQTPNGDGDQVFLFLPDGTPWDGIIWDSGSTGNADHVSISNGNTYTLGDNDGNGIVNDNPTTVVGGRGDGGNATAVPVLPTDMSCACNTPASPGTFTVPQYIPGGATDLWVEWTASDHVGCNSSFIRLDPGTSAGGIGGSPTHMDGEVKDASISSCGNNLDNGSGAGVVGDFGETSITSEAFTPNSYTPTACGDATTEWAYTDHPTPGEANDDPTFIFYVDKDVICDVTEVVTFTVEIYNFQHVSDNTDTGSGITNDQLGSLVQDPLIGMNQAWDTYVVSGETTILTYTAGPFPSAGNYTFTTVWDDFSNCCGSSSSFGNECYESSEFTIKVAEPLAYDCDGDGTADMPQMACNISCDPAPPFPGAININEYLIGGTGDFTFTLSDDSGTNPDESNSTGVFLLPTDASAGPYTVTIVDNGSCGFSPLTITIDDNCEEPPICPENFNFTVNGGLGPVAACPGDVLEFCFEGDDLPAGGAITFLGDLDNDNVFETVLCTEPVPVPPCPMPTSSSGGTLFIASLIPNGDPTECGGANPESITICNGCSCDTDNLDVDISGWELDDNTGGTGAGNPSHVFPAGTILASGECITLSCNYNMRSNNIWNNSSDDATLHDASGVLIDIVSYSGSPANAEEVVGACDMMLAPDPACCEFIVPSDACPIGTFNFYAELSPFDGVNCPDNVTDEPDANSDIISVTVDCPTADLSPVLLEICPPTSSADIPITISGGTGPYSVVYSINGTAQPPLTLVGSGVITINGPTAGEVKAALVSITDTGGSMCAGGIGTNEACVNIRTSPDGTPSASTQPTTCSPCDGTVTFNFTGSPPYNFEYAINGGAPQLVNSVNSPYTLTGLCPGTYDLLSLEDEGGCEGTVTSNPQVLAAPAGIPLSVTMQPSAICNDGMTSIDLASAVTFDPTYNAYEFYFFATDPNSLPIDATDPTTFTGYSLSSSMVSGITMNTTFYVLYIDPVTGCPSTALISVIVDASLCCEFVVSCPAELYLGEFACDAMLPECPTSTTEVSSAPYNIDFSMNDPCGTVVVECVESGLVQECDSYTITQTITVFDDLDGNGVLDPGEESEVCTFTYDVLSPNEPTIICPADETVLCAEDISIGTPIIETFCNPDTEVITDGPTLVSGVDNCPNATYEVVYTLTDGCSQSVNCTQKFTLDEPILNVTCPDDETGLSCGDALPTSVSVLEGSGSCIEPTPIFVGTVGSSDVSVSFSDDFNTGSVSYTPPGCTGDLIQLFSTGTTILYVQLFPTGSPCMSGCTIEVIILPDGNINFTQTCPATGVTSGILTPAPITYNVISVSDDIDPSTFSFCPADAPFVVSRTYIVEDDCGTTGSCVQTFTYDASSDNPEIVCPADATVMCASDIMAGSPEVTTDCEVGSMVTSTAPVLTTGTANCDGATYQITYTATDDCGRTASCIQTFTLSNSGPEITCPADATVMCASDIMAGSPEVTTDCEVGSMVTSTAPVLTTGTANCDGATYQITYTATDDCGRIASCIQTFTLSNSGPEITCPADATVMCASDIMAGSPEVTTDCEVGSMVTSTAPVLTTGTANCDGATYQITYTATDDCGRTASCIQTFTLSNSGPETTCPADATVMCASDIMAGSPEVTTDCEVGSMVTSTAPVLTTGTANCDGAIYQITYTATDDCGRTASCIQTFTLSNSGPEITCPADATVMCASDIMAGSPEVTTDCEVGSMVTSTAPVLTTGTANCDGATYQITYTATDDCSRTASCIQTFTLSNSGPEITCPADATVMCASDIMAGSPEVTTDCEVGSMVTSTAPVLTTGTANCDGATYQITYTATDDCGRTASCIQTFTLSNSGPEITCPADATVMCASDIMAGSPEVTTDCEVGSMVTSTAPVLTTGTANCDGATYQITYTATDDCSRTASCIQTFTLSNSGPEITCPADATVICASDIMAGSPEVTTDCEVGSMVTSTAPVLTTGTANCDGAIYQITYTATDDCGRTASCIQTFTLSNSGPEITCPADATVMCASDIMAGSPEVTTDCEVGSMVTSTAPVLTTGTANCDGATYQITYTATDDCGRTASCIQTFTLSNSGPEITCPENLILECASNTEIISAINAWTLNATASSACNLGVEVTSDYIDEIPPLSCELNDGLTVIFRAEDECGRIVTCSAQVFMNDKSMPTAVCQDIEITIDPSGITTISSEMIDSGSFDNCEFGTLQFDLDVTDFTCDDIGENIVQLTVSDECDNTDVCMATVTVLRGVDPPKVNSVSYCIEKLVASEPGLQAICSADCSDADVFWYDAEVGGNLVGSGTFFNPITAGMISNDEIGCFTFYAECGCSTTACRSLRTPGVFESISCNVSCAEGCLYTLILEDSGFDGWEGASLDLSINEGAQVEYKLSESGPCSPGYQTIPILIQNGGTIGIAYWEGGDDVENAWRLVDALGNTVAQSGYDSQNCNTIVPTLATGIEEIFPVNCPECCSDELSPFNVRITVGTNPDFLSWEIYDGSAAFQGTQIFGITANTYAGLAPGTQVNYNIPSLDACNEYTVALFDGFNAGWSGASFELITSDVDYGQEIVDPMDEFFGQSIVKFMDDNSFIASDEVRMSFTVPCKPICESKNQIVADGDCFGQELILPIAEPVICYPDCNHSIGCEIQVRHSVLIDQNDQNTILLSDFVGYTGQTEINYDGIADPIQAGCHAYVTEFQYCDGLITKCTADYTVYIDGGTIACNDDLNVPLTPPNNISTGGSSSLSDDLGECVRLVTADMLLEAGAITNTTCELSNFNDFYQVVILDENDQPLITYSANGLPLDSNGNEILPGQNTLPATNFVSFNEIKQTLSYTITHKVTGTTCWGNITIEDKNPPTLITSDYEVSCNDPNILDEFFSTTDTVQSSAANELPANIAGGGIGVAKSNTWIPFSVTCGDLGMVIQDVEVNLEIVHSEITDLSIELHIPLALNDLLDNPFANGIIILDNIGNVEASNKFSVSELLGLSCKGIESTNEINFISESTGEVFPDGHGQTWYLRILDNGVSYPVPPFGGGEVTIANIAISCGYPFPYFAFDCDLANVTLISETVNMECASISRADASITRVWQATDACGQSTNATQTVRLVRPSISDIELPAEITTIECGTQILLENGEVDPLQSGVPSFCCNEINDEDLCKISISYEDDILNSCGSSYKVLRTWQILNWCNTSNAPTEYTQLIVVGDHTGPTIRVDSEITIQANNDCNGYIDLSNILVEDVCSEVTGLRAEYTIGNVYTGTTSLHIVDLLVGNPISNLPTGPTTAQIIATDDCGNVSSVEVILNVLDDNTPSAICESGLNIALNGNGTARLYAADFDAGSRDNCSELTLEIKSLGCLEEEFAEYADFSCCDLGEVMVELRVTDASGNTNTCWGNIIIEDPIAPQMVCSDDVTIDCNEAGNIELLFQEPEISDNCGATFEAGEIIYADLPNCGQLLSRTYIGNDGSIKSEDISCTQTVTIAHVSDFIVQFPGDQAFSNCTLDEIPGPIITEDDCENIGISIDDQVFVQVENACYKIERTYTIINHCIVSDPSVSGFTDLGTPLPIPNTFRDDDGYFQYTQIIEVTDEEAPTISLTLTDPCDFSNNCSGEVALNVDVNDSCSSITSLELRYEIDAYSDGTFDILGSGTDAAGIYPYGDHIIKWIAVDGCGNTTSEEFNFSVEDCKNPTPVCQSVNTVIMNNGDCIAIWASDLLEYASDNCTDRTIDEWKDNARIRRMDMVADLTTSVELCCTDIQDGGVVEVEVWIEDEAGNSDFCLVSILVQDNGDNCPDTADGSSAMISGITATESDYMVQNVSVFVDQSVVMTNEQGAYSSVQETNRMYTVKPEKLDNPREGISTFDLVLLAQHVLQINELNTPYQLIAADVNADKTIDILDMVELRQLILYAISEFPSNTSWKFVDASYIFQSPSSPWFENYPQSIDVMLTENKVDEDFVAIKIGDLDGDASKPFKAELEQRNSALLEFSIDNLEMFDGNTYKVDFRASDFNMITGYQFTLEFDQNDIDFVSVKGGSLNVNESNFGFTMLEKGIITTSFSEMGKPVTFEDDEVLFSINFVANRNTRLKDVLALTSQYTRAEAYDLAGETKGLVLSYEKIDPIISNSLGFELYQNNPNPFNKKTIIGFVIPENISGTLRIYDLTGKVIFEVLDSYERGYHEVIIDRVDIRTSGALYYQFSSEKYTATRKMILLE